ncbi:MAG: TniQ family protein [Lachnospiraceae bacterium]|nr:TniQ family protein [Lachnospiraceae bacterium]MDE7202304.1 TniQ family protein [Lachnospiraceae bacterium]
MIAYLPTIYPDELVYSWFCRYYVHSGCFSHKMALQELYCKRSDNPSKEFIGNLNPEAREQIDKMYPLDKLVLDHTMYPQYARFIPLERKKTALYHLGHDPCDIHHLFPVLPRGEGERYLRFCPLCVREDRDIYGEAYWHRRHQIRNMRICTKHKCMLMESSVPAKSEQSFTFCPAENYTYNSDVVYENDSLMIRFVEYLDSIFDAPMDFDNDISISSILYDGMSRTKYLKPSGRSRYTKMLADDMNEFYRGMGICSIASMYQIQRALLEGGADFSVICQIAFFLGMKPEELTAPSLTVEQINREKDSHYMKDAAPVDWELLDMETAPVLEKFAKDVYDGTASESGRPERVSEKLVYREMNLLGHQLENMPRCKAIFERYTESYPESWARKIIWAYKKLKESGEVFYWSDIRKISGVKKKNFQLTIPYLTKYTDADMVGQIMALVIE